jgi:hypothetical protein
MMMNDFFNIELFFPNELLSITSIDNNDSSIHIKMRSKTHVSKCLECGCETTQYHGTYLRKVQDLPILGKTTQLEITAHSRKDVYRSIIQKDYKGGQTADYDYMNKIIKRFHIAIAIYTEVLHLKPFKKMQ